MRFARSQSGEIHATLDGVETWPATLTVRPIGVLSVALTPNSVVGSQSVAGKVNLECKAGPGPITVDLASSNAAIAHPVAANIVVPAWLQSESFTVNTNPVPSKTYTTMTATANGIKKSKTLTLTTAAVVSPTSLRFANQTIGTTSSVLNATLTNKGTVPFSVVSIAVVGTNSNRFTQTNNCPVTLAAGASCTTGVTFTPLGYPGASFAGQVRVADIGIPTEVVEKEKIRVIMLEQGLAGGQIAVLDRDANKGDYGHLLVIAGSLGKAGAAIMAAKGALRSGAGLVSVETPMGLVPIIQQQVFEAMCLPAGESVDGTLSIGSEDELVKASGRMSACAIGPGLTTHYETVQVVKDLIQRLPFRWSSMPTR